MGVVRSISHSFKSLSTVDRDDNDRNDRRNDADDEHRRVSCVVEVEFIKSGADIGCGGGSWEHSDSCADDECPETHAASGEQQVCECERHYDRES